MDHKEYRQRKILEIVSKEAVETQRDLVDRLAAAGLHVTQATVSRDISELRLVRVPMGRNQHRYALSPPSDQEAVRAELAKLFHSFVHDVDLGENLVVIRTTDGHAVGVAFLIDRLGRDDIVGTLAGQDTIFVVARTTEDGQRILAEFGELLVQ